MVKHQAIFGELRLVSFESFSSAQKTAVVKHVLGCRIKGPVVPFARVARLSRDLDKAVVQGQVVPDRVLPSGELLLVVWKLVADEVADTAESQFLHRALENGHGYESDVGIRRFDGRSLLRGA